MIHPLDEKIDRLRRRMQRWLVVVGLGSLVAVGLATVLAVGLADGRIVILEP